MKTKSLGLAAIALGCSIGVAEAQVAGPGGQGPSLQQQQQVLNALAQQQKASGAAVGAPSTGSRVDINNLNAPSAPGFVPAVHATNCGWFSPDGVAQWYYVFPLEGGIVFVINNPNVAYGLLTPCTNGNIFTYFVTDSAGHYNQTFSWPYRP
jgi:hypothetical protein